MSWCIQPENTFPTAFPPPDKSHCLSQTQTWSLSLPVLQGVSLPFLHSFVLTFSNERISYNMSHICFVDEVSGTCFVLDTPLCLTRRYFTAFSKLHYIEGQKPHPLSAYTVSGIIPALSYQCTLHYASITFWWRKIHLLEEASSLKMHLISWWLGSMK